MDPLIKKLTDAVKEHQYGYYQAKGETEPTLVCKGPHAGFNLKMCWKAEAAGWLRDNAMQDDIITVDSVTTTDLAQKILSELDEGAMLTSFLFLAEGIDTGGQRAVYSDGMPDIAVHQEMGMLYWALKRCEMHMEGKN